MEENLRLGRIAGIQVGMSWSILVIFWLITWSLATEALPQEAPGHSDLAYWTAGVAAAVLFFSSLLAHEMGHALLAKRSGIEVEGITLWLFGGVARLEGEASNARSELRVALVGPAISLIIGVLFGIIALLLSATGSSDLVVAAPAWIGRINIILALFNLAPGYPLDGGRVLRGALWLRHGNRIKATVTAARCGQYFAWLLISLGLVEFLAGIVVGGVWFVFLGWFLLGAARAESQRVIVGNLLGDTRVRSVMTPHPIVVSPEVSVEDLLEDYTLRHHCSAFPVVSAAGVPLGLVTLSNVRTVPSERRSSVHVKDIASPMEEIPIASPDELVVDLIGRLTALGQRALVMEQGRLVGIITPTDITRALEWAKTRAATTNA